MRCSCANGDKTTYCYRKSLYPAVVHCGVTSVSIAENKGESVGSVYVRVTDSIKTLPLALMGLS